MTPTTAAQPGRDRLQGLVAVAVPSDPDNRQGKEEAVLATVARVGMDNPALWEAFNRLDLSRWRPDLHALADAVALCFIEGVAPHPDTVRARLDAGLPADIRRQAEAALTGILAAPALDVTVAIENAKTLSTLDRIRDAEAVILDAGRAVEEAKKAALDGKADPAAADAAFKKLVNGILDTGTKKGLTADPPLARDTLAALMADLNKRRTSKRAGLDYGFPPLNEILSGLGPGLFVFGGITSCGKTTLMNQVADHVAAVEKVPVLFFAYEQGSEDLLVKSLSRLTAEDAWPGVDIGAIQKPWLANWDTVRKAEADYARGPGRFLRIIDAGPEHTVETIRFLALMAKRREERRRAEAGTAEADAGKPPCLLVIDYLQQMPAVNPLSGREFQSVRERIDFILAALRRLSRELQAPILVLVSLNRAGYDLPKNKTTGRLSGPPDLTVFKESGGIEYSADAAFCMGEDEVASREDIIHNAPPDRERPEGRRVILFCLKNRNGRRTHLQADFYPAVALFRNVEKSALGE